MAFCSIWFRVEFLGLSPCSFGILFHHHFLVPSGSGLGFRTLSPFFSVVSFSGTGRQKCSLLRMNVVETWFVAVWGLCWCNVVLLPLSFINTTIHFGNLAVGGCLQIIYKICLTKFSWGYSLNTMICSNVYQMLVSCLLPRFLEVCWGLCRYQIDVWTEAYRPTSSAECLVMPKCIYTSCEGKCLTQVINYCIPASSPRFRNHGFYKDFMRFDMGHNKIGGRGVI